MPSLTRPINEINRQSIKNYINRQSSIDSSYQTPIEYTYIFNEYIYSSSRPTPSTSWNLNDTVAIKYSFHKILIDRSKIKTNDLIVSSTRVISMIPSFESIFVRSKRARRQNGSKFAFVVPSIFRIATTRENGSDVREQDCFPRHLSLETSRESRSRIDPSIARPSRNDAIDATVSAAAAAVATRIDASWIYSGLGNDPIAFAKRRLTTDLRRIAAICKR